MDTVILSTAYFPPVEYFVHILETKSIIIDTYETYKKQTYRNRCSIYTEKGLMNLSIPVAKPFGNHSKTRDITILKMEKWKSNHWKSISNAYQASPFFLYYGSELKEVFYQDFTYLYQLNDALLRLILNMLEIDAGIKYSTYFIQPDELANDFRFTISPKAASRLKLKSYVQVFSDRHGFISNLSILDLIFNLGPEARMYLKRRPSYSG
ncbi:MAG: WbqC family protein [Chlorobi bacterium]|nr:WbqC family protein [Chlorobiota bacterium]